MIVKGYSTLPRSPDTEPRISSWAEQVLLLKVRVDQWVMSIKGYSIQSKIPEQESHHEMQY